MRHTDRDRFGGYTNDTKVIEWIAQTSGPVFVASDNEASTVILKNRFPGRIISGDRFLNVQKGYKWGLRHTTQQDAVADLWVASFAMDFMGTSGSTFSDTINDIRMSRGKLHFACFCEANGACKGWPKGVKKTTRTL